MIIQDKDAENLTRYMEKLIFYVKENETDKQSSTCMSQNLHLHEIQVLIFLGQNGPSNMKTIGENLTLSLSNLTAIVDKLEAKSLAKRQRSLEDRRVVMVHLTDQGQDIFNTHHEVKLTMSKTILEKLDAPERVELIRLMKKITDKT